VNDWGAPSVRGAPLVGQRPQDIDPDIQATEEALASVDLDDLDTATIEIDPVLLERARSTAKLKQITIRVGEDQLEIARRVASAQGEKYQQVIRRWLAHGASKARRNLNKTGT